MNFKKYSWLIMLVLLAAAGIASWLNVSHQPALESVAGIAEPASPGEVRSNADVAGEPPQFADGAAGGFGATTVSDLAINQNTWTPTSVPDSEPTIIEAFTEPYRDVAVAAAEMGTIATITAKEGQRVSEGDVLATLDERVLLAALEVARRSMTAEGQLKSAQADLEAKADAALKVQGLRERGHASQQELERAESDRDVAEARLQSVREDLEVKQLEFRRIEAQIEQRVIRAPIKGIVTELQRDVGEFVSPSDPVIARIVQLDPVLVVFSVPLANRDELQKDETVELLIGDEAIPHPGIIEFVAPTPDSSNSSVRVKVRVANPSLTIQSGDRATLQLAGAGSAPSLTEPTQTATPVARREP